MTSDALPDLSKMDPEWWLSGADGALRRLPPGHWRDTALDKLNQARSALSLARAEKLPPETSDDR